MNGAEAITAALLWELKCRKGFDGWFGGIAPEVTAELVETLIGVVGGTAPEDVPQYVRDWFWSLLEPGV